MALAEILVAMSGLWLASSAIALVALIGVYAAERTRSLRDTETEIPAEAPCAAEQGEALQPSRQRQAA